MDVLEAIKTRRSIRKYKDTPVDDKILGQVLEAAQWAPSWFNSQCWRFIIVRDADTKAALASALNSTRSDGSNHASEATRSAPVVIVACAELGISGYYRGEVNTDKGDWFMFDVALAMQNMALAAHALGLGTVHVGALDAGKITEIMNVPEGFAVVEVMPLGYPDQEARVPPRKELSEIVFYENFPTA
jgi:nitroreductase